MHDSNTVDSAKESASAHDTEIEITPAMIEAGAEEIWRWFYDVVPFGSDIGREVAKRAYLAMASVQI
jgi:hypothetical protein